MSDKVSKQEMSESGSETETNDDNNHMSADHEQKCIQELLSRLQKNFDQKDFEPLYTQFNNLRIYRFAKARNFVLEDAWTMLENDVNWRKEKKVDELVDNFPKTKKGPALIKYWPSNLCKQKIGLDKRGFPVYVERIGQSDPRSLMKAVTEDELVDFHIYIMEMSERNFLAELKKQNLTEPPKEGIIFIEDCTGLGFHQFYTPGFNLLKKLFAIDEAHYPEGLKSLYIINAPAIFTMFQKIISPFLDPTTVQKLQLLGSDYLEVLSKEVDLDQIPAEIGGKLESPQEGGAVFPGGVYGGGTFDDSLEIKEVTVPARGKFEEKVEITEEGSVIAWEFRTKDYNIGFGVSYQSPEKSANLEPIVPSERLESQLLIQSQHICQKKGTYILSWDNTFSVLRSKSLAYTLLVEKPIETAPDRQKKSKKRKKEKKSKKKKH